MLLLLSSSPALGGTLSARSGCPCLSTEEFQRFPTTANSTHPDAAGCDGYWISYEAGASVPTYCYPTSYGDGCAAHDEGSQPYCEQTVVQNGVPEWCVQTWCYVDSAKCTHWSV